MHILSEQQEKLFRDERNLLNDLRVALVQTGTAPEDQETLASSIIQLEEIFLLVVVGEFNAGKSAFINALLGQKYLKEGVTPTTTQINVLHHSDQQNREVVDENIHILNLPAPLLHEISIVDTPGTNAVIREHEQITTEFVPRSDLVIFLTSADRPFTESENAFLQRIRDWGKKIIFVINKIDIIENEEEISQIIRFVAENAFNLLSMHPEVFPVSSRLALRAKQGEPELWGKSKFESLELFISNTLDEKSRIQLKLLNPLGVGRHLIGRYLELTNDRLNLLKDDFMMIEDVSSQLSMYREDMLRDFQFRMADIENIFFEMEQRGDTFFEDTFRIARFLDLFSKDRIQSDFENIVINDVPQRIEKKINELIDWLVEANFEERRAISDHLAERLKTHQSRIVGDASIGTFHYDREKLIASVGQETRRVIETFNKENEAREIAEGAQEAVAASAAIEVGAIGLGTLITALATTVTADVTGILLASFLAAIGLFVIPARRRQAKNEMQQKVGELRNKLSLTLSAQFQKEIDASLQEVNQAISPYTRFVRAEQAKLNETNKRLQEINLGLQRLEERVKSL